MTSSTINLRPLDQSQQRSIDHLKRDHFEEPTENSFCFSLLRKVWPSRERPICPQQEIRGEPGLLALQAKGYHRFNWEEVTIDVHGWWQGHGTPSLPFKVIRPEEEPGHLYLISCVHVSRGRVATAKSHFHVNRNKKGNEATWNQHV